MPRTPPPRPAVRLLLPLCLALLAPACRDETPASTPAPASAAASGPVAGSTPAAGKPARKLMPVWEAPPDVLPEFKEPSAGPRAPDNAGLLVRVGETRLDEAKALTAGFGKACANRSVRVAMQAAREAKAREVEAAKAAGKGPDAVTGASILMWRSPRETNPQVRWSCEDIDMSAMKDRPRPSFSQARLLYVFDSDALPARLASLQRSWPKDRTTEAVADLRDTLAELTRKWGPPTASRGEIPPAPAKPDAQVTLPGMQNFLYEWKWADLQVKLNAVNLPKGLTISEDVEVPMPVRPDAPARPK
jgi:hypothetical protein